METKAMEMMRKERIDRGIKVRTEGIYAISAMREILYLLNETSTNSGGAFTAFFLELAPYWKRVINIMFVYSILAIALIFLPTTLGLFVWEVHSLWALEVIYRQYLILIFIFPFICQFP